MATNRKILDCITGDSQVRQTRQAVWRKLARELNQAGPEKDISQWRKVCFLFLVWCCLCLFFDVSKQKKKIVRTFKTYRIDTRVQNVQVNVMFVGVDRLAAWDEKEMG